MFMFAILFGLSMDYSAVEGPGLALECLFVGLPAPLGPRKPNTGRLMKKIKSP